MDGENRMETVDILVRRVTRGIDGSTDADESWLVICPAPSAPVPLSTA